jgi:hypothetical protein
VIVRTLDSRGRVCVLDIDAVAFAVYESRTLRDTVTNAVAEERSVRVHLRGIDQPIWLHPDAWPIFERASELQVEIVKGTFEARDGHSRKFASASK